MILNDENIEKILREANLFSDKNDYYFSGPVLPTIGKYVIFGQFANFVKEFSSYVINYREDGIGILPISNLTGKPLIKLAYFMPNEKIKEVKIENGGLFFYKKISIIDIEDKAITFKVVKNIIPQKNYKFNLEQFINKYQK